LFKPDQNTISNFGSGRLTGKSKNFLIK